MSNLKITWFISAHGFGHAARSIAIMEALYERVKNIEFLVVTETPTWFFEQNRLPITFISEKVDVGFIQKNAFSEDIPKTIEYLESFYFNVQSRFHNWDSQILPFKPDLIVADICPAALDYADSRQIPSILIENFTWDWLYEMYKEYKDEFAPISNYMSSCWSKAQKHYQIKPFCGKTLTSSTVIEPVSRKPKSSAEIVKNNLNLSDSKKTVLLTMGGVPMEFSFYDKLKEWNNVQFVIPGAHKENIFEDNLRVLTHHSKFYHPDLVSISDVIIGKVGYSTIAEVHNLNKRFGFVARPHFKESKPLVEFIQSEISGSEILVNELSSGSWVSKIDMLLDLTVTTATKTNGSDLIAEEVLTSHF